MNPKMPKCNICGAPSVIQWRDGAQCAVHNTFFEKAQDQEAESPKDDGPDVKLDRIESFRFYSSKVDLTRSVYG